MAERQRGEASAALRRCAADDQERIHALQTELVSTAAERDHMAEEIAGLTGEDGQVGTLSARVEDLLVELAELDDEILDQRTRAETAEETRAALEAKARTVEGARAALESDAKTLEEAARVERSERTKLRGRLDTESSRVAELNVRIAELEDHRLHAQDEVDAASTRATEAETRLATVEAHRADLERAAHDATVGHDRLARRLADVEAERDEMRREPKAQAASELAEIARRPRDADMRRSALDGLRSLTDP